MFVLIIQEPNGFTMIERQLQAACDMHTHCMRINADDDECVSMFSFGLWRHLCLEKEWLEFWCGVVYCGDD
jgi:hypothetical protein